MKDKIISSVRETKNYGQFKFLEENRELSSKALKRISKSVEKEGWRNYPITVNEKMEIIEGQHTFTYAKEHRLPVRYIVVEGLNKKDCQIMNSARTRWKITDYIHYFSKAGDVNYKYIELLVRRFTKIPVSVVIGSVIKGDITKHIHNGTAVVTPEMYNEANVRLSFIEQLMPYITTIGGRRNVFIEALLLVYDMTGVDRNRLATVIQKNCHTMSPASNYEQTLGEIERVYNRQLGAENRIYMVTEWKKSKGV